MDNAQDRRIRAAAFQWLAEQVAIHGDVLPRKVLETGFIFDELRVHLVGPQGIFKPKVLSHVPISITTAAGGRYDDAIEPGGLLRYSYRGTDPEHHENESLRLAMKHQIPLIYFHRIATGKYLATWPAYIVADDPKGLAVRVAIDDDRHLVMPDWNDSETTTGIVTDTSDEARRAYITASVRVRLHQRSFRERVLEAYRRQCAFCRLRHEELLEAAHIIPDSHPDGAPEVRNGISLCTLHHSAFDRMFIGITPAYKIEVRPDILREKDGPTLSYAIQALHGQSLIVPRSESLRPDTKLLTIRYEQFRQLF